MSHELCQSNSKTIFLQIAVAIFGLAISRPAAALGTFTITDLGVLPGSSQSGAFSINSYGQVAGNSPPETFLWTPDVPNGTTGTMIDLGRAASEFDFFKINNYGQVIFNFNGTYLWTPDVPNGTTGITSDIGAMGDARAVGFGLNNLGQIVGYGSPGVCFLWTPNVPNGTIGTFNRYFNGTYYEPGFGQTSFVGEANAINDAGQLTGKIAVVHPFPIIHSDPNDHYTTADIIPAYDPVTLDYQGHGNAINAQGHVAGSTNFPGPTNMRPFLYDGSAMIDISSLGGEAYGLNNSDAVVGKVSFPVNGARPFLYTGGTLLDLNTLLPPASGWMLTDVFAINDFGQMVGVGFHNGQVRGFLMTPQ